MWDQHSLGLVQLWRPVAGLLENQNRQFNKLNLLCRLRDVCAEACTRERLFPTFQSLKLSPVDGRIEQQRMSRERELEVLIRKREEEEFETILHF